MSRVLMVALATFLLPLVVLGVAAVVCLGLDVVRVLMERRTAGGTLASSLRDRFAQTRRQPLGVLLGFSFMLWWCGAFIAVPLEFSRSVLGLSEATSRYIAIGFGVVSVALVALAQKMRRAADGHVSR